MNRSDTTLETDTAVATEALTAIGVFGLAFVVFIIVCLWRIFTKANKPGWAAIVPFYNVHVLLKIVGRPGWWLVLYIIPVVNIVIGIIVTVDLVKAFRKDTGIAVLLVFLPIVGMPMLAFGSARYVGPVADPNFSAYVPGDYLEPGYPSQPPYFQQYAPQQPGQQYPLPGQYPPQQ
jgi:hypothetical protein